MRFILAGIALLLLSCATQPQGQAVSETKTTVPFELIDNRIFVDVFINNQGPFKFIFDTGSSNVLTPRVAKILGLKTERDADGAGAGEKSVKVDKAIVSQIKIGEAVLKDQHFSVIDMSDIQKAFNLHAFDGTFGYEVLLRYLAYIDFEKSQLTLAPGRNAF